MQVALHLVQGVAFLQPKRTLAPDHFNVYKVTVIIILMEEFIMIVVLRYKMQVKNGVQYLF